MPVFFIERKNMKKIFRLLILNLFIIIPVFSKGTIDEAKAREQILNEANKYFGYKYPPSLERAAPAGTIDCSHFFYQSLKGAGLNGADGKGYITTAGLRNLKNTKNIPATQLKPGDAILMHPRPGGKYGHVMIVRKVLPNGQVEIIDSSSGNGVKVRTINYPPNRYAGAVSVTDMITANGYTPVNSDGTVVTPPAGSSAGSPGSAGDDSQKIVKSDYLIDLNAVLKLYVSSFDKGAEAIGTDLIIALTFVFALTFLWEVIKNRVINPEVIIGDFFFELFKFVFFLVVIKNFPAINRTAMNLCFKVAEAFGSTLTSYYVLNELVGYYAQNVGVLIGEFSRQAFGFAIITNLPVFVIIFCLIIYTTLIFTYIIFQVVRAVMTYIIGTNFSLVLLPFYFSRYSGEYIPNPFSIFFKCVAQLFFTVLIIAISLGVLSDLSQFLENAIKSSGIQLWVFKIPTGALTPALDIMSLCTYAVAFTMVALIMKKTLRTITTSI